MLVLNIVSTYMFPLILFNLYFCQPFILNYNSVMDHGDIALNGKAFASVGMKT